MSSEASAKPSKRRRIVKTIAAVLALGLVGVFIWLVGWIFPIGTGISAKTVCSDVFVAGRSPEGLLEQEVPKAFFVGYEVDEAQHSVRASAFGFAGKTAVYRPGLGCTLALGVEPETLRSQGFEPANAALPAGTAPWPEGDGKDERPDPAGLDRPALEAAIAELFVEEGELPLHTRAVVVVQDGRLLAERYAPGFDADTPQLGWSMSKSVTSALVGVLVGRGEVDIDQPIGFAEWSEAGDPRADNGNLHCYLPQKGRGRHTASTDIPLIRPTTAAGSGSKWLATATG